jgi:hypothetical protein
MGCLLTYDKCGSASPTAVLGADEFLVPEPADIGFHPDDNDLGGNQNE